MTAEISNKLQKKKKQNTKCFKCSNNISRVGKIILFLFFFLIICQLRMYNIEFCIKSCNLQSLFVSSSTLFFPEKDVKQDFRIQPFVSICKYQKTDDMQEKSTQSLSSHPIKRIPCAKSGQNYFSSALF